MNPAVTLEEAANTFLATFPSDERGKFSQEVNRFLRWFGLNHPASSLTPPEIGNYAEQVAKSGGDYLKKLEPVKAFLQYLKKQGITSSNLSVHLKPPPAPAKTTRSRRSSHSEAKVLTREGFLELETQLTELKKELPRIVEEITRARADKDFRENSPLDAAREAQAIVQSKILDLETTLKFATLVEDTGPAGAIANIGNTVSLKNVTNGDVHQFKLVDPKEADAGKGKISFISPLGRSLLGKREGEIVEVVAPIGVLKYRIVTIGK